MARPDRKRLVRGDLTVNVSVCGWPPVLQEEFGVEQWWSPAVVCPAFRRGAAAAGPDGCPRAGPHRSLGFVDPGYVSGYSSSSARPLTPSRLFLSQASLERDGWSMLWALGGRHPPLPSGPR